MSITIVTGSMDRNMQLAYVTSPNIATFSIEYLDMRADGWSLEGSTIHDGTDYIAFLFRSTLQPVQVFSSADVRLTS